MKPLPSRAHFITQLVTDVVVLCLVVAAFPVALAMVVGSPLSVDLPADWFGRPRLSGDLVLAGVAGAGWLAYALVVLTFLVELTAAVRNTFPREAVLTREVQRLLRRRLVGAHVAALVLIERLFEDDYVYVLPGQDPS